jgi:hypothetical protein
MKLLVQRSWYLGRNAFQPFPEHYLGQFALSQDISTFFILQHNFKVSALFPNLPLPITLHAFHSQPIYQAAISPDHIMPDGRMRKLCGSVRTTRYRSTEQSGFDFQHHDVFLLFKASRPTLGFIQPLKQSIPGVASLGRLGEQQNQVDQWEVF